MVTTLYKRSTSGKIQVWKIELKADQYRSISGEHGGKMTTAAWTTAKPKNIGRANSTNASEQAALEVQAKINDKLNSGYGSDINLVDTYKQKISPMLAKEWEDYREKSLSHPLAAQPKLDGIRAIGTKEGLFSREGNQFLSCPHIESEVKSLLDLLPSGSKLDGELYNHEFKNDFNAIVKIIKREKCKPIDLAVTQKYAQYHIYDIDIPNTSFGDRFKLLLSLGKINNASIQIVETVFLTGETAEKNQNQLDLWYSRWMEQGFEGQMIRVIDSNYQNKRTKDLLKRKEFKTEEFVIQSIQEGEGNRSGMAGAVLLENPRGAVFGAGIRGDKAYFIELLQNMKLYIGKKATIRYQNLTPDGVPRFPVMIAVRDYE